MTVFRNDKFLSTSPDRGLSPVENPVSKLEGVKESETCGGRRHEGCDVGTTVRLMDHTKNVRRGNVRRSAENLRCASAATPNGLRGLAEAAVLTISLVREEFPRAPSTLFAPPHRRRSLKSSHDSRATHAREDAARAVSHTPRFRRDAPRPDRRKRTLGLLDMALAASASAFGVAARASAPSRASSGSRAALRGVALAPRRACRANGRAVSITVRADGDLPQGWPPRAAPATTENNALDTTSRSLTDERRDIAAKAKQLMNIDPNDPHALDCIGSSTKCLVQFRVPYNTVEGEDLFILGSDDKLGRWNQANALPMNWGEGGNWWANVDLPAGGVFFYKYAVRGVDGQWHWQEGANNLLVLPDPWDIPSDSLFVVGATSRVCRDLREHARDEGDPYEKEIVQLRMEAVKAKEMMSESAGAVGDAGGVGERTSSSRSTSPTCRR